MKDMVNVNDGKLYCETYGEGEPILFIHGFSFDHRMWIPQVEYFQNNFQVICYDMRGFGKSSLPTGEYSHHEDVKALLDYLRIELVHLVGLSLGGEVSIDFAITYPDYVQTLTLIDSSLGGYPSKVDWRVYAKEQGLDNAKHNWLNHAVFKHSRQNAAVNKQLETFSKAYSGWHWLHHDPRLKVLPSAMERLPEIKAPTQIIVGDKDLDYYHSIAGTIHQQIKGSKLTILPNTGHLVSLERVSETNNHIETLVKNRE